MRNEGRKEGERRGGGRTSSGHSTDSFRQISLSRKEVELTSSGLNRNLEQREVMGSMILHPPR